MPRKKKTVYAKVDRPRRNKVSKEKEITTYTFKPQKCEREKKNINVLKKRMTVMDDLLIKQMYGKLIISKKSILKYLKELEEMRMHCTREDLKQVNEKLIRCMEICLETDEDTTEFNNFDHNIPTENILSPKLYQNNNLCSYGDNIIERCNTPVLRSDQTTPSGIDIEEIISRDNKELYTNNTTAKVNVIENNNLMSVNNVHRSEIHRTSEIAPTGHLSGISPESIVRGDGNLQGNTLNHSIMRSDIINYDTSTYHSEIFFESQSLLKEQELLDYITTDDNVAIENISTNLAELNSKNTKTDNGDFVEQANIGNSTTKLSNGNSDNNQSQSILKEQEIEFHVELTEKYVHNTKEIIEGEKNIATVIENSFELSDILKDVRNLNKTKIKKKRLSKKPKKKQKGNVKPFDDKDNLNDTMSNLHISPKIGTTVSSNGNMTNTYCTTTSTFEMNPDSMTESINFSDEITKQQKSNQTEITAKTNNNIDWSKVMNLNWLKNIQFIRTIENEEFQSACNLSCSFWNDDSIPSEVISDFD